MNSSDLDRWRAAATLWDAGELMKEFGGSAELEAARRADEATEKGDLAGEQRWLDALAYVRRLRASLSPDHGSSERAIS